MKPPLEIHQRFNRFVKVVEDGCWEWIGGCDSDGYGFFTMRHPFLLKGAHRVAWYLGTGRNPAGKYICHHCDNPKCVRVSHLYEGTPRTNMADMVARKRNLNAIKTCERNPSAKLTWAAVDVGRQWRSEGMLYREIAQRLGVSLGVVCRFVNGETWREENRTQPLEDAHAR